MNFDEFRLTWMNLDELGPLRHKNHQLLHLKLHPLPASPARPRGFLGVWRKVSDWQSCGVRSRPFISPGVGWRTFLWEKPWKNHGKTWKRYGFTSWGCPKKPNQTHDHLKIGLKMVVSRPDTSRWLKLFKHSHEVMRSWCHNPAAFQGERPNFSRVILQYFA